MILSPSTKRTSCSASIRICRSLSDKHLNISMPPRTFWLKLYFSVSDRSPMVDAKLCDTQTRRERGAREVAVAALQVLRGARTSRR